jgi:tetratricopeptide (TPR) repeat protein
MKAFYLILVAVLALPSCSPIRDREELSKETLNSAVSDKGLFFEQFLLAKDLLDQENGLRSRNSLSAAVTLLRKSKEIAPDRFWPLDFYLGYAYGLQGKSQLSLQYFLQAAKLSGTTFAWENAALIASQKGDHLLAYSIYDYLRKHKSERITDASAIYPWLDKAYGGSQKTKTSEPSLSDADQKFYCKAKEETSEDDNSDDEDSSTSSKSESDTASLNVATGVPSMNFSFVKPDPASEENKDKTEQVRKDPVVQKELIDPCDIKTVLIDAFVIKRRTMDNS